MVTVAALACVAACRAPQGDDGGGSAESDAGDGDGDGDGTSDLPTDGDTDAFFDAMGGLWTGPVTMTPLGNFPLMNFDMRVVDGDVLFGRVDLDAANALRFAFAYEDSGNGPELIFRNGGLFDGASRDTRTRLVEHGDGEWRFCALDGGCNYVDALFWFDGPDSLELLVFVKGEPHVDWAATRVEPSTVPDGFPGGIAGDGSQDFPPMGTLSVDVSWPTPLDAEADVWVIVSNESCPLQGPCAPSRFVSAVAEAGATSVTVAYPQIHAGEVFLTAILDRDRNLGASLLPSAADAVSIPNKQVTIAATGTTETSLVASIEL